MRGPLHYTLTIPTGQYQSDLLSAVLPTSNQAIAPASSAAISDHFAGNLSENGAYLGIPLILLLVASVAVCRRSKVVIIGFLLALSAYVLSLGSPLRIDNHDTGLPMPAGILQHLPLLNGAVLARFSAFVFLFAALVFGVAIERLRRWSGWPRWWVGLPVALVVSGAVLVPLWPDLPYPEVAVDTPSFFSTAAVQSVPEGSVAVVYPPTTPVDADSTLWQATAAMRFKMPSAYVLVPVPGQPPAWGSSTLTTHTLLALQEGFTVPETSGTRSSLLSQWRDWRVQTVIIGPGDDEARARQFVSWLLGRQPTYTHGVYVWHGVQQATSST